LVFPVGSWSVSGEKEGMDEPDSPSAAASEAAAPATVRLGAEQVVGRVLPDHASGVSLFFQVVTGFILMRLIARYTLRYVFRYQDQGRVWLAPEGVMLERTTELFGRVLRTQRTALVDLVSVSKEAEFPRAGLVLGLGALALGSFVGVGFVVEGLRSASGSVVAFGSLLVALGIVLDLALEWLDRKRNAQAVLALKWKRSGLRLAHNQGPAVDRFLEEVRSAK
jgi:hypothetical protein